jgi:uncharacterized protein YgiM (DUF1202 family)
MAFHEDHWNVNQALKKKTEEMIKIKRAQDNWSKVRQKKKVINMIKNLEPEIVQDLYKHKIIRDLAKQEKLYNI